MHVELRISESAAGVLEEGKGERHALELLALGPHSGIAAGVLEVVEDSSDYYKELLRNHGEGIVKGPAGTFKLELKPGALREDVHAMAAERKDQILAEGGTIPRKRNKPSLIITPQ